mgnify:CR=1 FL=1|jgi:predicted phage-related endonuclease
MKTQQQHMDDLKKLESVFGFDPSEISQGSDEWLSMRHGVLTASKADCLLAGVKTAKYKTYMNELIAEVCTGKSNSVSSASMDWGHDNEPAALSAFEFHTGIDTYTLPFIFKDTGLRIGCSPDAIAALPGVEIKCPKTSKVHIDFLFDDTIKSEYIKQIQFSMWVTDAQSWYFASYDPRMTKSVLHVKLVEKDEKIAALLDEASKEFITTMDQKLKSRGFSFGDQWAKI